MWVQVAAACVTRLDLRARTPAPLSRLAPPPAQPPSSPAPPPNARAASASYFDDLAWAALWLKRATGRQKYLDDAVKWVQGGRGWHARWGGGTTARSRAGGSQPIALAAWLGRAHAALRARGGFRQGWARPSRGRAGAGLLTRLRTAAPAAQALPRAHAEGVLLQLLEDA